MKHSKKVFSAIAIVLLGGWFFRHSDSAAPENTESAPTSAPSAAPAADAVASSGSSPSVGAVPQPGAAPALKRARKRNPAEPREQLEENNVEFTIQNGLAVAYGDVVLGKPESGFSGKSGITEVKAPELWKNGNIPYLISGNLADSARVEKAIAYLNRATAVKFVPYQNEPDAVVFQTGDKHCYSYLGKMGGMQPIFLAPECGWNEILHEMLHALGYFHEQSRPDRDKFVEILWENIDEEFRHQFDKVPESWADILRGTSFDYHSVMLYRPDSFAKGPGLITLKSKLATPVDPVSTGLSVEDIVRINHVYGLHD